MGPFIVKLNGRADHKVYVAVFTCFQSRSVHAEVVFKLDSDSAINAIIRFSARRPGLNRLYSDCGTNFKAANSIMEKEMKKLNEEASPQLARRGITWQFNPPYAPHRGGVWERVVGLFKKTLSGISKGDVMHYETFVTAVTEAEGILNRRPLTQISTDSRDLEALTPNHLLSPASIQTKDSPSIPNPPSTDAESTRRSWKRAQSRVDSFWNNFRRDYLSLLHSRPKWRRTAENLKKGDLVILVDDGIERNSWRMGRIVDTIQSDEHVRHVQIRRGDGKILQRDRTKVVKLEMELDE